MSRALRQYLALSQRALVNVARQPAAIVPPLVFPLLFLAMSSAAFADTTVLSGFPPVDSFFQFMITTTVVQGALFGSMTAGSDMAVDIEHGFFDRLIASPVARTSILVGRIAGAAVLGFVQAWWFIGIALLFGLDIEGGATAMLMLAVVSSLVAAGFGSMMVALAIKTGSAEAVQGSFPLVFSLFFLSSAFFPRSLMEGWFENVATVNPLSHLIESLRAQVIYGVRWDDIATALAIAASLVVVGVAVSSVALRARLAVSA